MNQKSLDNGRENIYYRLPKNSSDIGQKSTALQKNSFQSILFTRKSQRKNQPSKSL